jgi:DNA-binding NtrC family response regulator
MHNLNIKGLVPDAMELLKNYAWPGNIRELRNVIEHSFIIESTDQIRSTSLPESVKKGSSKKHFQEEEEEDNAGPIDYEEIKGSVLNEQMVASGGASPYQISFSFKDDGNAKLDFQIAKDYFEKEFIIYALKTNKGKINQTALKANIPKKTLLRKIEKYEINPKDYY